MDRRSFLARSASVGVVGLAARTGLVAMATAGGVAIAPSARAGTGKALGAGADRHGAQVLADWYRTLYSGLMDDPMMTPGRAARIYAACAVAGYEAVVPGSPQLLSLAGQLNALTSTPHTSTAAAVDWPSAVSSAIATTAASLLRNSLPSLQSAVAAQAATHREQRRSAGIPREVLERSERNGVAVGHHIAAWALGDGAEATFGRPYTPPVGPSLWRSTAPNFGTAIDPWWGQVRPMALPSSDTCAPPAPVPFSTEPGSAFHDQALAVLAAADSLTDAGRATSLFWRDNPVTSGLPSGHWMRITAQVCGDRGLDLPSSAEALVMAGVTLNDAFISCWQEKYTTNLLRPISYIRAHVPGRETWSSFVNTPQFPEYTSGHSVASQAVADALTDVLGTFTFTDRTHGLRNPQLGERTYASFQAAAMEAAGSRLLGGIHYPMGIDVGLAQGSAVASTVLARVTTRG